MIKKLFICNDGKLLLHTFIIHVTVDNVIINILTPKLNTVKIPIYNKYTGITYVPICFPIKMPIIDNKIFNPYLPLSSFNFEFENTIDFFNNLKTYIKDEYKLDFLSFDEIIDDNFDFMGLIYNKHYSEILEIEKLNVTNIDNLINNIWNNIHVIKLLSIYILIKCPNMSNKTSKEIIKKYHLSKKIFSFINYLKSIKLNLYSFGASEILTFCEYYIYNKNTKLLLPELKINHYYFIVVKQQSTDTDIVTKIANKIIKIKITKIDQNIVSISEFKNIIFDNYEWYLFYPNLEVNKNNTLFQTFVDINFTNEIIKKYLNIENIHSNKIIEYYNNTKLSNLMSFGIIFENLTEQLSEFNILKLNSYSDDFFEYITKKYSSSENNNISDILTILFSNYNFPLKPNRHEFDSNFDHILYFSIYNYKSILINTKNTESKYDKEFLHPNINGIVPVKFKNLYINLLRVFSQLINNEFDSITYNQKFYNDYLHRNIIKLFFTESNKLSINLLKNLLSNAIYQKFKNIVQTNMLLIDITHTLNWSNLPKKLNYLNIFYKNTNIIHYQDRINRNIMPENFDNRIKKIIENPFEMFKYLRKEKDFIKWTKFTSDKIIQLYYIPISLSSDDFNHIGKMIYLLFNITEQNTKEQSYINFINFCNLHPKLILDSQRINLKIREFFSTLKANINLGFLAKHLTWDKESITFDEIKLEKSIDVLALEHQLHETTKKYYKYKAKYIECKDDEFKKDILLQYQSNETSSFMPSAPKNIFNY